jgi:TRAP-type C4-dicarboxylate transport system permease small subunit
MGMLLIIRRISDITVKMLLGISMTFLALMTILVFTMVVTRYLFGYVFRGTEELSLLLLLWVALMGAAVVIRRRDHIAVNYFLNLIPEGPRTIIEMAFSALILWYLGVLTKYAVVHAFRNMDNYYTAMGISMFWAYSAIYVGSGLMIFFVFLNLVEDIVKILQRKGA